MEDECILITGGAGYIGSHAILAFQDAGYRPIVIDNLATGLRQAVPKRLTFIEGDAGDQGFVQFIIEENDVKAVVHFAGSVVAPESVSDPLKYYANNTCVSRNLIEVCIRTGVRHFIFSSTALVYGPNNKMPLREDSLTSPINPYGTSKLMTEWILRDTAESNNINYAALRYFNVAGADPEGRVGQSTPDATHLIKVACQTALGLRDFIEVFGEDYDTPDGTCIRDYIHVTDLVDAHVKALHHLEENDENLVLNCGYGRGFSVREVLAATNSIITEPLDIRTAPRRPGDPPRLISDPSEIRRRLHWQPKHDDLKFIIGTALEWERRLSGTSSKQSGN